ncbi:hypothetical protein F2P56_023554 [Juglans regia]|uniref:Uncharacterized protein LOC108979874 n=2 Tax=Juglans regia TaxID=51240 RepID=A0A2I4DGA8_JUGRE|nr:uncharacterized protein LOC108979874 [Juglans regia]KAF5453836.1 hypothetical protein F2P56_023554 [Juglans regia]
MAGKYHVRSISLPSISHPCTLRLEEELNKLRIWEATSTSTSESISHGLVGLDDLYNCMDDLLKMTSTQQVLSQHQHEKYVEELLDGSVRLLDICGITREATLQIREHVQALQSALRRRKGDSSIESSINNYTCFRKKMKKDAKKLITALKQMENKFGASPALDLDHPLSVVIRVLRQVCAMNVSIFQSLLLFCATPVSKPKPKPTGWSLVSKMMHKGATACEEKQEKVNQMQDVDAAVGTLRRDASSKESDTEKTQSAHRRLKDLVISIEDLENGLGCVFRRLIKTRASLLNIISQ